MGQVLLGLFICVVFGCVAGWSPGDKTPRMTKEELRSLIGHSELMVVDVRIPEEWKKSDRKIPGAVYEDPEKDVKKGAEKYPPDKTLVFYCS